MILRRKRLPASLERPLRGFRTVVAEVEQAKAAMTDVMPTTRLPGRPVPDALLAFEEHLARAESLMASWRAPQVEAVWQDCRTAVDESRARAGRLRDEAPELGGFEGLIAMVEGLMAPLEAFERAAARFRGLRV
jgi:hypothetical protein